MPLRFAAAADTPADSAALLVRAASMLLPLMPAWICCRDDAVSPRLILLIVVMRRLRVIFRHGYAMDIVDTLRLFTLLPLCLRHAAAITLLFVCAALLPGLRLRAYAFAADIMPICAGRRLRAATRYARAYGAVRQRQRARRRQPARCCSSTPMLRACVLPFCRLRYTFARYYDSS